MIDNENGLLLTVGPKNELGTASVKMPITGLAKGSARKTNSVFVVTGEYLQVVERQYNSTRHCAFTRKLDGGTG